MSFEITGAKISFVSLVKRAANKKDFLIMKQRGGQSIMANQQITEAELEELIDAIAERVIEKLQDSSDVKKSYQRLVEKAGPHYLTGIL